MGRYSGDTVLPVWALLKEVPEARATWEVRATWAEEQPRATVSIMTPTLPLPLPLTRT